MKINIYVLAIIVVILVIISVFYYALKKLYAHSYLLIDQPYYAKDEKRITKNMKTTICNKGITWTYNFWIYINDWEYRFGEKKHIIQSDNVNVWLGEKTPNLYIGTNLFNNDNKDKVIEFKDLPLQKWLNIAIILDNRTMDLFINKELYRSIFFDEVPNQATKTNFTLLPGGGYSGYISQFRYFSYNLTRSRVRTEYNFGFRGLWYKYFIIRMIYKTYMFFYKMIYGDNEDDLANESCS
tara:strand:- start:1859 stop:2575 length:717 start_codon:yes stop_codon:yes gene_type:complete